jgi:hypothetical protein
LRLFLKISQDKYSKGLPLWLIKAKKITSQSEANPFLEG